jgi:glycosyltransferase involved in cell wall biosynthesis
MEIVPSAEAEALWKGARNRIITVGKMKEQKNHALLIRSLAILRRSMEAKLMILGHGELSFDLEALARSEGVEEDVIFPGFTLDPWPYYASADLFALSSDYEGYPLVLIEALRSGLKIVSTDCESGPKEILADGEYGQLVPCGDARALAAAIGRALSQPEDGQRLKARAEQLSGVATADRYLRLMLGHA